MIEQKRILATSIPGPASQALQARKTAAVAAGVSTGLPVYVERGGRRHRARRRRQPAHRLRLGHRRDDRRQRQPAGRRRRHRADQRLHPHLLHGHAVRGVRAVAEKLNELDPRRPREALGAVQLRRRGRRERRQDRPPRHRAPRRRRVRPRLPRPHQPHDGADRQEHALQAPLRPVRRRALPRADGLPLPLAGRPRALRRGGPARRSSTSPRPGRRGQHRRRHHRADPGRGRLHRARPRASSRGLADWCREHGILFIADEVQTGFCRTGDWFACDHEGVVPDLVTTAKGIAGGMPLAAVTGRADLMDAIHAGGLGGTYGGNPVACAAALAVDRDDGGGGPAPAAPARSSASSPTGSGARREVRRDRRRPWPRRDDRDGAGHRPRAPRSRPPR